ncbi:unnamed protein product [Adineta steineri]|nr:unnamed protein product [Adineta steineri]
MKLMQQHPSNINVQGQPPEKKLRATGSYAGGDPSNYDYQRNPNQQQQQMYQQQQQQRF